MIVWFDIFHLFGINDQCNRNQFKRKSKRSNLGAKLKNTWTAVGFLMISDKINPKGLLIKEICPSP